MGFATISLGDFKSEMRELAKVGVQRAASEGVRIGAPMLQRALDKAQPGIQQTLAERSKEAMPELVKAAAPYLAAAAGLAILLLAMGRASARKRNPRRRRR